MLTAGFAGAFVGGDAAANVGETEGGTPAAVIEDRPAGNEAARPGLTARVVRRHIRVGRRVAVRGRATGAPDGAVVRLKVRRGGGWHVVDQVRVGRGGRFSAAWRPSRPGRYRPRVVLSGGGVSATARLLRRTYVYRSGFASWYGPGSYGSITACGGRLGPDTIGVAHKTLPCGTKVTFRYGRRSATIRVIDRGPFIAGRDWDLTGAAKRRLGFPSTGPVLATR